MLERRVAANGVVYYASPRLEAIAVRHGFSTRVGGVSERPFDSLNLGNPSGSAIKDDNANIARNMELFESAIGLGERGRERCWVWQVHGGEVVDVRCGEAFESGSKADALVGNDPQRTLCVRTADCVPVFLASGDGKIVAAIHAGWRGVIAGVAPNALRRMGATSAIAAIGPGIGFEAFEVGAEVLDQFERAFGGAVPVRRRDDGKGHVDLRAAIRLQLIDAGVSEECIDVSDRCSFRDADEFYSHRRDNGVTGRMAALIAPAAG